MTSSSFLSAQSPSLKTKAIGWLVVIVVLSIVIRQPADAQQSEDTLIFLPTIFNPLGDEQPVEPSESERLPLDFYDLVTYNAEKGVWTETEGIITILQVLNEELELTALPNGDGLPSGELNHFIELVDEHLSTLPETADKLEINRLRDEVFSDFTHIDDYAEPLSDSALLSQRSVVGTSAATCRQLWRSKHPKFNGTNATKCYFSGVQEIAAEGGGKTTVKTYFQRDPDNPNLPFLIDSTRSAVVDSVSVFNDYDGDFGNIVIVFSPLRKSKDTYAVQYDFGPGNCKIVVYASAIKQPEAKFKQTIAHEIFHCWQDKFLDLQVGNKGSAVKKVSHWWVEGTAEYFSNVVYPGANDEYRTEKSFRDDSKRTPITQMSYETFLFWQYLGNSIGDEQILALLKTMPTSGDEKAQARALALAGNGNMDTLWHQFAQTYLDHSIRDTDGGIHYQDPTANLNGSSSFGKTKVSKIQGDVKYFTVPRIELIYEEKLLFEQMLENRDDVRTSIRKRDVAGSWESMPDQISACPREEKRLWLPTTVVVDAKQTISLDDEKGDPDRCACYVQLEVDNRTYFSDAATYTDLFAPTLPIELSGGEPTDFILKLSFASLVKGQQSISTLEFQDLSSPILVGSINHDAGSGIIDIQNIDNDHISGHAVGEMLLTPLENATETIVPFSLDFRAGKLLVPGVCSAT